MFRLLNIEYHKLKYNKASRTLTLIYFLLLTSVALIASIKFDFGSFKFHLAEMGVFNFPYIWHLNTWLSSTIKFFLLLVIVSLVANEYSYKTLKQNLIDGLSKKEFILSKFYMVLALSAISTIFVFVISLILGLLYSDYTEANIVFSDLDYIFAFFIKLVGFFSFGLFLGIFIKRSAFAVGAMLIWSFVENVIIKGALYYNFRNIKEGAVEKVDQIMQFLPLEAMSNLIKEPISRFNAVKSISKSIGSEFSKDYSVHISDIIIVICWTFIFIYLSYALLKKRDL